MQSTVLFDEMWVEEQAPAERAALMVSVTDPRLDHLGPSFVAHLQGLGRVEFRHVVTIRNRAIFRAIGPDSAPAEDQLSQPPSRLVWSHLLEAP